MSDQIPSALVSSTLNFISELKNHYGAEQAMDTWNQLSSAIADDKLTMTVFTAMLNGGRHGDNVTLIGWTGNNKIHAIKELRRWCDLSLYDAKRAVEAAETGHRTKMLMRRDDNSVDANHTLQWQHMSAGLHSAGLTIQ
jgi:ribosomal protein L7/L12